MEKAHWGFKVALISFSSIPIEFHCILNLISFCSYLLLYGKKVTFLQIELSYSFSIVFFWENKKYAFLSICSVNSLSRWNRQGPLRIRTSAWSHQSRWTWCPQMAPVPPLVCWSQVLSFHSPFSTVEEKKHSSRENYCGRKKHFFISKTSQTFCMAFTDWSPTNTKQKHNFPTMLIRGALPTTNTHAYKHTHTSLWLTAHPSTMARM